MSSVAGPGIGQKYSNVAGRPVRNAVWARPETSRPGRIQPAAVPVMVGIGCAAGAVYGITTPTGYGYSLSCMAAAAVVVGLEVNRQLRRPDIPWWITQSFTLPWVGVVLVPWTVRIPSGSWAVGRLFELPGLGLPLTWTLNLLALFGFAAGTLAACAAGRRGSATVRPPVQYGPVRAVPAAAGFTLIAVAFLASFIVAGRPFASIWLLSGEYFYSQSLDTKTAFGPLELAPGVAVIFVIALAGLRRRHRRWPTVVEVVALLLTMLATLGSGTRSRSILLMLGWVFVQFLPTSAAGSAPDERSRPPRPMALALCGLALTGAFVGLGLIASWRTPSRGATQSYGVLNQAVDSLDVVGSEELLLARGARLGSLHGRSYTELPGQFMPRAVSGDVQKQKPASVRMTDDYLDPRVGFSAPYWMESALNFGRSGVLIFCFVFAAVLVRVQLGALSSGRRLAQVCNRAGPVMLLVWYTLLSRLSTEQFLYTTGSFLVGAWLASRAVAAPGAFRARSAAIPDVPTPASAGPGSGLQPWARGGGPGRTRWAWR
jgi:hypothetical protein